MHMSPFFTFFSLKKKLKISAPLKQNEKRRFLDVQGISCSSDCYILYRSHRVALCYYDKEWNPVKTMAVPTFNTALAVFHNCLTNTLLNVVFEMTRDERQNL